MFEYSKHGRQDNKEEELDGMRPICRSQTRKVTGPAKHFHNINIPMKHL